MGVIAFLEGCSNASTSSTSTSTSTSTSSPSNSTPSQNLECTTVSGSVSLGKQPCAASTVACFKIREVMGDQEVDTQACDDKGLCALVGNPQDCCVLSTSSITQDIICSPTDFDSPLAENDFANCDRACDVSMGAGIAIV